MIWANEWTWKMRSLRAEKETIKKKESEWTLVYCPKELLWELEKHIVRMWEYSVEAALFGSPTRNTVWKIFVFIFLEHFCKILTRQQHGKKRCLRQKWENICVNSVQASVSSWHSLLFIVLWYFLLMSWTFCVDFFNEIFSNVLFWPMRALNWKVAKVPNMVV